MEEGDIKEFAEKVYGVLSAHQTPKAKVLFLQGDLGAGKTTFTKELASLLGIEKEEVLSPTFILKKEYTAHNPLFRKLVHIDAYRFAHPKEAKILQLQNDLENPNTILAIEWPEKLDTITPDVHILFETVDDTTREVTLTYKDNLHEKEY